MWAIALKIGSAIVMVRQPRMPCYKLAAKFQRDDMIERFMEVVAADFIFRSSRKAKSARETD